MRYVPSSCLREGMILGKTLYGQQQEVLLHKGMELGDVYISRIAEMGFPGVYIDDELSSDIEIEGVISDELRLKSMKAVKEVFSIVESGKVISDQKVSMSKEILDSIIDEIIQNRNAMVNMIDLKSFDDYTYSHSVSVTILSVIIGIRLDMNREDIRKLGIGALLHDIGKVFVAKEIVNKPEKLTSDEFEEMKSHAKKGYDYIKEHFNLSISAYVGALQHHEKFDGTGYPNKHKGTEISLFGRIIALADVYDALTSNRPYRPGLLPSEAIEYIMANGGSHFDPTIVKVFLERIAPYPVGMLVKLSNGQMAIVAENYENWGNRPKVKVIEDNGKSIEPFFLDLKNDPQTINVTIVEIVMD